MSILFKSLLPSTTRNIFVRCISTSFSKGDPYTTEIKLRRKVDNISYPKFGEVESLKWAKWQMLKDVKRRIINGQYWQYRLNLKCLSESMTLPNVVRQIAAEERLATPRDSSVNRIVNRCALTARPRGRYGRYRMSRIVWRDQADHGMISGSIRARWG